MKITANSRFEKSILKYSKLFIKIMAVLFSLLMILDFIVGQQLGFENSYLGNKKEVVLEFKQHNLMLLAGFSYKVENGVQSSGLRYILVPKIMSFPKVLYIFENSDGSVDYENDESMWVIVTILLLLYGVYVIGSYVKLKLSSRESGAD